MFKNGKGPPFKGAPSKGLMPKASTGLQLRRHRRGISASKNAHWLLERWTTGCFLYQSVMHKKSNTCCVEHSKCDWTANQRQCLATQLQQGPSQTRKWSLARACKTLRIHSSWWTKWSSNDSAFWILLRSNAPFACPLVSVLASRGLCIFQQLGHLGLTNPGPRENALCEPLCRKLPVWTRSRKGNGSSCHLSAKQWATVKQGFAPAAVPAVVLEARTCSGPSPAVDICAKVKLWENLQLGGAFVMSWAKPKKPNRPKTTDLLRPAVRRICGLELPLRSLTTDTDTTAGLEKPRPRPRPSPSHDWVIFSVTGLLNI